MSFHFYGLFLLIVQLQFRVINTKVIAVVSREGVLKFCSGQKTETEVLFPGILILGQLDKKVTSQ